MKKQTDNIDMTHTNTKKYILEIIDRDTGKIIQTETRKSQEAFDRLWYKAMSSVNALKYKLKSTYK